MKRIAILACGIVFGFVAAHLLPDRRIDGTAQAQGVKPALFVNMTTGDSWRGWMGLHFAHSTMKMGHPVTIFLNLEGVTLASLKGDQEKRASMQRVPRDIVADFIRDGGKVLICGPCLSEFGLKLENLVPGVELGKPGLTQGLIFAADTRTLTW